jgi:hypothetical protein
MAKRKGNRKMIESDITDIELARQTFESMFGLSREQSIRIVKDVAGLTTQEVIELYSIYIPDLD